MKIKILATGSKANSYIIESEGSSILIDPGLPFNELQKKSDFSLSKLDLCLLSHEHMDHARSIKDILKIGVRCAMTYGTAMALDIKKDVTVLHPESEIELEWWRIIAFAADHDSVDPCGFLIVDPTEKYKICYATDTASINYDFLGVTHWVIECNHSIDLLMANESLPENVKYRIESTHFSLESCKDFFKAQDLSRTESIHLIHMSEKNSDCGLFTKEIEEVTGLPVYTD